MSRERFSLSNDLRIGLMVLLLLLFGDFIFSLIH